MGKVTTYFVAGKGNGDIPSLMLVSKINEAWSLETHHDYQHVLLHPTPALALLGENEMREMRGQKPSELGVDLTLYKVTIERIETTE